MARRAAFKGDGQEYLEGIPSRHLDEEDWQALSKEQRDTVRGSSLYDVKTDAQMSSSSSSSSGGGD